MKETRFMSACTSPVPWAFAGACLCLYINPKMLSHGQVCFQKGCVILSRVEPPAFNKLIHKLATLQICVVDVGDLQFVAAGWFERFNDIEDVRAVHVYSDHSQVALRLLRLLDDSPDLLP